MAEVIIKSTEKKTTKREWFGAIRAFIADGTPLVNPSGAIDFLDKEVELLDRKKSTKKLTPEQIANEAIKEQMLALMAENGAPVSIAELSAEIAEIKSPQHASALLAQLVKDGKIVKSYEKKVVYFSLADEP